MIKKKNLKDDIRNSTSLLEIISENIDVHVAIFTDLYYKGSDRTKKEIIKIVIDDLNNELEFYDQRTTKIKTSHTQTDL